MSELTKDALLKYINVFENLTKNTLKTDLMPLYATNAYFEDPFNQTVGHESIEKIFLDMFEVTKDPKFYITEYAMTTHVAFLSWEFNFKDHRDNAHNIIGTSIVTFNANNEVKSHVDYWDTGKYLYQKIPVLRWIVRKINQKLSATHS